MNSAVQDPSVLIGQDLEEHHIHHDRNNKEK